MPEGRIRTQPLLTTLSGLLLTLPWLALLIFRYSGGDLEIILPGSEALSSFTSANFILCGLALLSPSVFSRVNAYRVQLLLGLLLCLSALLSMAAHFLPGTVATGDFPPVAPNSSLAFFLAGLYFISWYRVESQWVASTLFMLTLLIGTIALLALVGLALGFDPIFGWSPRVHISGYTIAGLLLLSATLAVKTWRRVRRKQLNQVEGLLFLAAFAVIFSALAGGLFTYTIAGANIYNNAIQQLHLLSHERAERIHSNILFTETRIHEIAELLSHASSAEERQAIIEDENAYLEFIPSGQGDVHTQQTGTRLPTPIANSTPLYQNTFFLKLNNGSYYLKKLIKNGKRQYAVYYPLRLNDILHDNFLDKKDYTLTLCGTDKNRRCMPHEQHWEGQHTLHSHNSRLVLNHDPAHIGIYQITGVEGEIVASITLPHINLSLIASRKLSSIYSTLYKDMLTTLPVIVLLTLLTIILISVRLIPLIRTLRSNAKQFQVLTDYANDMISLHDIEGNYTYVSPACHRLLGYEEAEIIGHSAYEFFHPDDIPKVQESHSTVTSSTTIPRITYRIRTKNGSYRWFETISATAPSRQTGELEIIAVSRDVTEKQHAEEALRKSEEQYRTLIEQASDAIFLHSADRRFIEVNQAACNILGYSRDELIGMHPEELLLPHEIEDSRAAVEEMRVRSVISRKQLLRKDGHVITADIHGRGITDGRLISILRDVSDQVKIESELHDSREHWRSLVETAPDTIMTVNRNAELLTINHAPEGVNPDEVIGQSVLDFVKTEHRSIVRDAITRVFNGEANVDYEVEAKGDHGNTVWWASRCGPVYRNGLIVAAIIITRDISERHAIEFALKESEKLNRSIVEVLAEGIVVQDSEGHIISSNRAAKNILGRPSETTQGKHSTDDDWSVIREDGRPFPGTQHPAMIALQTGESQRDVVMGVMRPDGERVWISVNSTPMLDDSGSTVTSVVTSFSDITAKMASERELHESQEQLRALTAHLQEVREDEKEMIAREVHDELGSTMTALKLGMSWVEQHLGAGDPQMADKLKTMSVQLNQAVTTVRRLVTQLRPTLLDDLGLWEAIEWQLREFSKYTHIEVADNLHCQQVVLVNRNKALAVYRVIQEALTNIAKHSHATRVRLDCWDRDDRLHITLEDNGIGLSDQTVISPTSHGLRGMSERITAVGGTLEILGSPNEGTVIALAVPHDDDGE